MKDAVIRILDMTAWRMETPVLFGGFHIAASLTAVIFAAIAACLVTRRYREKTVSILTAAGWVLVILEIWKQLFLYYIVSNGIYDWWFFPFQLCSVPMYLSVLLPAVRKRTRRTFLTFMCGYTFVSAAAALIYPEDILRSYTALTVHGFVWHGILLFMSLVIAFAGEADASARGIIRATGLFAILCVIAIGINMIAEPVMQNMSGLTHSWAAMFYLNPYHVSPQPIVGSIQKTAGIPAGLLLYSLSVAAVSSAVIRLWSRAASGIRKVLSSTR